MTVELEPLRCSTCGATIAEQDLDRALGIATCPRCATILDLRKPGLTPKEPPRRPLLPIPERFRITEEPGAVRIEWRWFHSSAIFLAGFCVFWDGFLVVWYRAVMDTRAWTMAVFILPHLAVGVGLTYWVLASFLNRTVVEARLDVLTITHGPLPWRGVTIAREALAQLYVEENVSRGKSGTSVRWGLSAVLRDGRRRKLLTGLRERLQARYLERVLEARFGIAPGVVDGEARDDGARR